jgi:hypothetical protein
VQTPRADPRWEDEPHPWAYIDAVWLGVDLQGHVAVFTTAGFGPVPMEIDQHLADVEAAVVQVEQLPVIGSANYTGQPASGCYIPVDYSVRGFYVYDWEAYRTYDGPYTQMASPAVPVSVSQLPAEVRAVAQLVKFPVKFADGPQATDSGGWF